MNAWPKLTTNRAIWLDAGGDIVHGTIAHQGTVHAVLVSGDGERYRHVAVVALEWRAGWCAFVHASAWSRLDARQAAMGQVLADTEVRRGIWRFRTHPLRPSKPAHAQDANQPTLPGVL